MSTHTTAMGLPRGTIDLLTPPTTKRRRTDVIDLDSPSRATQTLAAADGTQDVRATDCSFPSSAPALDRATALPATGITGVSLIDLSALTQPDLTIDLSQESEGAASAGGVVINLSQFDTDVEHTDENSAIIRTGTPTHTGLAHGPHEMQAGRESSGTELFTSGSDTCKYGGQVEASKCSSRVGAGNGNDAGHSSADDSLPRTSTRKVALESEYCEHHTTGEKLLLKVDFKVHDCPPEGRGHLRIEAGGCRTQATEWCSSGRSSSILNKKAEIKENHTAKDRYPLVSSTAARERSSAPAMNSYPSSSSTTARERSSAPAVNSFLSSSSTAACRRSSAPAENSYPSSSSAAASVRACAPTVNRYPSSGAVVARGSFPAPAKNSHLPSSSAAVSGRSFEPTVKSFPSSGSAGGSGSSFAPMGNSPLLSGPVATSSSAPASTVNNHSPPGSATACGSFPAPTVNSLPPSSSGAACGSFLAPAVKSYPSTSSAPACGSYPVTMVNSYPPSNSGAACCSFPAPTISCYPSSGSVAASESASVPLGKMFPSLSSAGTLGSASAPTGNSYPSSSSTTACGSIFASIRKSHPLMGSAVTCGSYSVPIENGYPPSRSAVALRSASASVESQSPQIGSTPASGCASVHAGNGHPPSGSAATCGGTTFTPDPYRFNTSMARKSVPTPSNTSFPVPGSAASCRRAFASTANPYLSSGSTISALGSTITGADNTSLSSGSATATHSVNPPFPPLGVRPPPITSATCHGRSDVHHISRAQNATTALIDHENTHYYVSANGRKMHEGTADKTAPTVQCKDNLGSRVPCNSNLGSQMLLKTSSVISAHSAVSRGDTEAAPAMSGHNASPASFSRITAGISGGSAVPSSAATGGNAETPHSLSDKNFAVGSDAAQREEKKRERLARCEDIDCYRTIRHETTGKIITEKVSIEEIEALAPVTVKAGVFPDEFADDILKEFLQVQWRQGRRWLIDKEIVAHRLSTGFAFQRLRKEWERSGFADLLRHAGVVLTNNVQRLNHADPRSGLDRLRRACGNQPVITLKHLAKYLPSKMRAQWKPDFCVCNYYVDANDFLGAHSDPVQGIGPYAIVAAVTFGGARQFRLKPVFDYKIPGVGTLTGIGIRLPHNSLCVMWEGTQEFWRHEVPKDHHIVPHPLAGEGRLSFTFRQHAIRHLSKAPKCKCNSKAVLKPVFKNNFNFGRYFWSCSNPRRKGEYSKCDFFQWDDDIP